MKETILEHILKNSLQGAPDNARFGAADGDVPIACAGRIGLGFIALP